MVKKLDMVKITHRKLYVNDKTFESEIKVNVELNFSAQILQETPSIEEIRAFNLQLGEAITKAIKEYVPPKDSDWGYR